MKPHFWLLLMLWIGVKAQVPGSGNCLNFPLGNPGMLISPPFSDTLALPLTVSAWVRPNLGLVDNQPILSTHSTGNAFAGLLFRIKRESGVFYLEAILGNNTNSTSAGFRAYRAVVSFGVLNGRWNHVAAVVNSTNDMRLFLNGEELVGSYNGSATQMLGSLLTGGRMGGSQAHGQLDGFNGDLDHVSLYRRALNVNEIRSFMCRKIPPSVPNLLFHFPLDSGFVPGAPVYFSTDGSRFVTGTANLVTSGAPIGDTSVFLYTTNWIGSGGLSLFDGDSAQALFLSNPGFGGFHIYKVRESPNSLNGLGQGCINDSYYGYFRSAGTAVPLAVDLRFTGFGPPPHLGYTRIANNNLLWTFYGASFPIIGGLSLSTSSGRGEFIFSKPAPLYNSGLQSTYTVCNFPLQLGVAPNADWSIQWSNGSIGDSVTINTPGNYQLIATYQPCNTQRFFNFNVQAASANLTGVNVPDTLFRCVNDSARLNLSASGLNVTWSNGLVGNRFSTFSNGTYSVQLTDSCGQSTSFSLVVAESSPTAFSLLISNSQWLCNGVLNLNPVLPSGVEVEWFNGSRLNAITINSAGNYSYTLSDSCGYASTFLFEVFDSSYLNYNSGLADSLYVCRFPFWVVPNTLVNGRLVWPGGVALDSFLVAASGSYVLRIEDTCGRFRTEQFWVLQQGSAPFEIDLQSLIGGNCTYPLQFDLPDLPDVQYVWSDGSTSNTFTLLSPSVVWVVAFNACGVFARDTAEFYADSVKVVKINLEWCEGNPLYLKPNWPENSLTNWNNGDRGHGIWIDSSGFYVARTIENCVLNVNQFEVTEASACDRVYIPSAFSPNGDGINEVFKVEGEDLLDASLEIYNRWGAKVNGSSESLIWDGSSGGVVQGAGVYQGVLRYKNRKGRFRERRFTLTLWQ